MTQKDTQKISIIETYKKLTNILQFMSFGIINLICI